MTNEHSRNQALADRILRDRRLNGQVFSVGDCLALLDGRVMAVASTLDEALAALRHADPDPARGMVMEVGSPDAVDVIR